MQFRIHSLVVGLFVALTFAAGGVRAQYSGATPAPDAIKKGFDSINPELCKDWLSVLASDEFEGRGSGHPGYQKAADYVAARFKEFGLEPGGDNGTWFQMVPFTKNGVDLTKTSMKVGDLQFKVGEDFDVRARGGATEFAAEGPFLFVAVKGRRARLPDPEVVKGKILIVAVDTNEFSPISGQATRGGAKAVLTIREKLGSPRASIEHVRNPKPANQDAAKIVAEQITGSISRAAAEKLAAALGVDKKFLDANAAEEAPLIHDTADKKGILVAAWKTEAVGVPNVLAKLTGSDPELAKEYVICGSHLDHIGVSSDGQINNGADDDGSGSTSLLAVARAFAHNGKRPKRTLIFIAVCGEEMGLLGSNWYVENPIYPIEATVAELQMDMVGRDEESIQGVDGNGGSEKAADNVQTMHLVGSKKLSVDLHETVIAANQHVGFTFEYDEEDVYTRSDHYNFARKGIPISFFFSGFHADYHRPTDDVAKINFVKLANTAKLVFTTAYSVADRAERPKVDKKPKKGEDQ